MYVYVHILIDTKSAIKVVHECRYSLGEIESHSMFLNRAPAVAGKADNSK